MHQERIAIAFPECPPAQASRRASELEQWLQRNVEDITIERTRTDPDAMDLGMVLTILVSSAAAVHVAKGVRDWLARTPSGTIDWSDGKLVAKGLTSADMVKVVEHLQSAAPAGNETSSE